MRVYVWVQWTVGATRCHIWLTDQWGYFGRVLRLNMASVISRSKCLMLCFQHNCWNNNKKVFIWLLSIHAVSHFLNLFYRQNLISYVFLPRPIHLCSEVGGAWEGLVSQLRYCKELQSLGLYSSGRKEQVWPLLNFLLWQPYLQNCLPLFTKQPKVLALCTEQSMIVFVWKYPHRLWF